MTTRTIKMLPRETIKNIPEDADTSFEIDEPEDEEINENVSHIVQPRRPVSKLEPQSSSERDEQTDCLTDRSTNSNSSTPTTADVADIVHSIEPSPVLSNMPKSSPLKKLTKPMLLLESTAGNLRQPTQSNTADDNLSASIATTVTTTMDIDPDNVATSSRFAHNQHHRHHHHRNQHEQQQQQQQQEQQQQQRQTTENNDVFGESVAQALTQTGMIKPLTMPNHRRTHSAASYSSVGSMPYREQRRNMSTVLSSSVPSVHGERRNCCCECIRWVTAYFKSSGIGEPSVHHALVVIFLEFFAWGLLAMPIITVLNSTFPDHTFLMNGIVMGIKGILSFLSAPLIGALSDIWGRKFFLLITVFFTCVPIPLMTINAWWFFAMISMSGLFAVTFSVVFAYVADVTTIEERSRAYGLASATFAASLVISPALGNALMDMYGDVLVVALATAIAVLDVFFILVAVPESLPEKVRPSSWGAPINWEQADPFAALRKVSTDKTILMLCLTVLLSYLPEAGQYSCMFVYLKLKMGFNYVEVSIFIAIVGILSISVQVTLGSFMQVFGAKRTIILGLALQIIELLWYGLGSQKWMMWAAGVLAACASITYPAISAFVSLHAAPESQGAVQGMITGVRGLCNGLGPAMFGLFFYLFNVDLNTDFHAVEVKDASASEEQSFMHNVPGPPFIFGAVCAFCAILVAVFIPEPQPNAYDKKRVSLDVQYEIESGHKAPSSLAPLIRADSLAQL